MPHYTTHQLIVLHTENTWNVKSPHSHTHTHLRPTTRRWTTSDIVRQAGRAGCTLVVIDSTRSPLPENALLWVTYSTE